MSTMRKFRSRKLEVCSCIDDDGDERIDQHQQNEIKSNRCDIDKQKPSMVTQRHLRRFKTTTMKRIRGVAKTSNLIMSVKIFILVSIFANLYNHLTDQSLLLQAEAGSKSSKSSSKTTVIAIDGGGGGGGHAHPMPVPWPVVHCHHHHHHLKYVPKPILVHHWIKKHKAAPMYEIAASDKHVLELGVDPHIIEQPQQEPFINPLALPSSLPETYSNPIENQINSSPSEFMENNRLVNSVSSVFDDHPSNQPPSHRQHQQQQQFTFQPSTRIASRDNLADNPTRFLPKPKVLPSIGTELEKELKRLQIRKKLQDVVNNNITNKHIKKITNTISSNVLNIKKHFGSDADSDDSFMNIAVANSSSTQSSSGKSMNLTPPDGVWTDSTSDKMAINGSSGSMDTDLFNTTSYRPTGRNSGAKIEPRRGNFILNDFRTNLERANRLEQSQSAQLYEKVASEQEGRMQALTAVNQLLNNVFQPQQQQQSNLPILSQLAQPQQVGQIGASPSISKSPLMALDGSAVMKSRVANVLTESRTIEAMIKLAEQMARAEAKRLVAEQQRKLANKAGARNEPAIASKSLLKRLNLFGILQQPAAIGKNRNKRRRDSREPLSYNAALLRDIKLNSRASRFFVHPERQVIRSFNLQPKLLNTKVGHRVEVPPSGLMIRHYSDDELLAQASSSVNKVVEPPVETKHAQGSKSEIFDTIKDQGKSLIPALKPHMKQEDFNSQTTMSPIQEGEFYLGQQNHLMKTNRQQVLPNMNQTRAFNSMPSDLHNFIVKAPSQTVDSFQSLNPNLLDQVDNSIMAPQVGSQMGYNPFSDNLAWKQQRNLRSTLGEFPTAQPIGEAVQNSNPQPVTSTSEGGRLYQNFAENLVPMPSYLEFPMSPQLWSTEAMKSINEPAQDGSSNSSDPNAGADHDKVVADSSQSESNDVNGSNELRANQQQEIIYDMSNNQLTMPVEHKLVFDNLMTAGAQIPQQQNIFQLPAGHPAAQYQLDQMISSSGMQQQQPQQLLYGANSPVHLFTSGTSEMPVSGATGSQDSSYMFSNPAGGTASHYPSVYPIFSPTVVTKSNNDIKTDESSELMQASSGIADPAVKASKFPSANSIPFNGINQQQEYDPMEVATADMNQLSQFQNNLGSTGFGPGNNLTSMTRFSRQIRDQMRTFPVKQMPQMPNIPNIPQPPQLPNLPMPPPGMMQMAGLALPFAMARATRQANRNRDQQVNGAANNGGSTAPTTGQRIINRALTWTNRISRQRPSTRPKPTPASSSNSGGSPNRNRNRFMGFVQTVVDMSRRPPSSGITIPSASNTNRLFGTTSPKLKPKVDDEVVSEIRAKRLGRAALQITPPEFASKRTSNRSKSTVVLPGSLLTTVTDGSLARFASMTSPVDMLAEQLAARQRERQQAHEVNPHGSETNSYDIIDERPRARHHGPPLLPGLLPIPLVANHFNLLMFTAQNVTGQLMKPPEATTVAYNPEQEQQLQQLQQQQQPEATQDDGRAQAEGNPEPNSLQQDQEASSEHENSGLESNMQDQQGQTLASNIESYGERTPRPEERHQQPITSSKLITEKPVANRPATLSLFTVSDKSHANKMEHPVLKTSSSSPKEIELDQQKTEASMIEPVMQPKDSFWPLANSPAQNSNVSQAMPLMIPLTQFELSMAKSTPVPSYQSKWRKDVSEGTSRFNKTKKFPSKSLEIRQQQQHLDINTDAASYAKEVGPTPVVQTKFSNSFTTQAITTTTTNRPTTTLETTSLPPPDDYVRAIKLVRGVAYPWPPPTKSSKVPLLDMV